MSALLERLVRELAELRSRVAALERRERYGPYVAWTPTVWQGGANVAVTVAEARYCLVGKLCHLYAHLTVAASGSAPNAIAIRGQPSAAQPAHGEWQAIGVAVYWDDSAAKNYAGTLVAIAADEWNIVMNNTAGEFGAEPSVPLASGDELWLTAVYRVA